MNREERERTVDRLLNEALGPQRVEPRAGLEERIVAHLRAQPEPRPWRRWLWVPAAVAAAVLLIIALRPGHPNQPPKAPTVVQTQPAPTPVPTTPRPAPPVVATHRKPTPRVVRPQQAAAITATALPRQQVFPSPAPLTAEEQMLLALSRRSPAQAVLVAREREMEWQRVLKNFEDEAAPKAGPVQNAR